MSEKPTYEELDQRVRELEIAESERKRAEEALRESEEKYRRIYENSVVGFFQSTPEGRFLNVNPAFAKMLGYESPEELVSSVSDIASQTYAHRKDRSRYHKALETNGYVEDFELKVRCKDGSELWVSDSSRAYFDEGGKAVRYEGIVVDITERKRAEEELYKSEAMTKALLNGIAESAFLIESDGTIIAANTTVAQRLNCPVEELIGSNVFTRVSHEVSEFRRKFIDEAVQTGKPVQFEDVRSGRNIENRINPILDQQGNVTRLAIVGIDITERRRVEKALRENRELLDATQRLAKVGGWLWDVGNQTMNWTDETYRIHGFEPGDVAAGSPEHVERSLACYDPEDRPVIEAAFLRCAGEGIPYDLEFPFTSIDGRRRWIQTTAQPVCEDRRVVRVTGNIVDITERKQAEGALRQRLEYEQLLNEASTMAFVADDLAELYDRILALVGDNLGVDRAYFFRHDEATDTMDNTHEWCADGIASQQDKLQGIPASAFSWWLQTMRRNEIICYPNIKEIPDEATKEILSSQDIKSILVVPLFINGQYYGFLGLDDCARRRDWRQEDVDIFSSLSRILAMATERRQAEKRLQDERQQLLSIFNGIEEAIYIADPETYEVLFINDFLKKLLDKNLAGKKCYEQFQGFDAPCEFCTNQMILQNSGEVYRWEYYNPNLNRHYLLFDRIIKWNDGRDVRFEMAIDITEPKQAEEALKKSEASLKEAQRLAEIGNWSLDLQTGELSMSYQMHGIIGLERSSDALDVASHEKYYTPESWQRFRSAAETALETGKSYEIELEVVRGSGGNRHVVARGEVLKDENGQAVALRGTLQDITERVNLQAQLNQAQKIESIGRLAGGVAHDLNNLLSPILGYSEMLRDDLDPEDDRRESVDEIMSAGLRARDLVRQLLAFSRKQILEFKPIDLNKVVAGLKKLLQRTIREDIEMSFDLSPEPEVVMADMGQIEQVIMNLAVNAADAMPKGGQLTIETSNVDLDEEYAKNHQSAEPGRHVMLAISDTGHGMDEETQEHIFEPFFSTKGEHGTGLGLSTVYGIVKQHGGNIWVYSEPGRGTTFKIYLPVADKLEAEEKARPEQSLDLKGSETILIVEDNDQVRHLAKSVLSRNGYRVLDAKDGREALEILGGHHGSVHLLLSDVVLPGMNGKELYEKALAIRPSLKILYMSGYTGNVIAHRGVLDEGVQFIQKPFTVHGLASKVRELLGGN